MSDSFTDQTITQLLTPGEEEYLFLNITKFYNHFTLGLQNNYYLPNLYNRLFNNLHLIEFMLN